MTGRDVVHLAIEAAVLAVDVTVERGGEQRVIKRGIEGCLLSRGAAAHLDAPQQSVPDAGGPPAHRRELPAIRRCAQVLQCIGAAHVGEGDIDLHAAVVVGGEAHPAAGVESIDVALARHQRRPAPGARTDHRPVEARHEVDGVLIRRAAEGAAGGRAAHLPWSVEPEVRGRDAGLVGADVEQQMSVCAGRKGEAPEPAAAGDGQLHLDAGAAQAHGVPARCGLLVAVRERLLGARRRAHRAARRQDADVTGDRAARAAQVCQAEAGERVIGVVVTAAGRRRRCVRAPLDHAERQARAREGVDRTADGRARGADEHVHPRCRGEDGRCGVRRSVGCAGGAGGRRGQEEHTHQCRAQCARGGNGWSHRGLLASLGGGRVTPLGADARQERARCGPAAVATY